jgi:hypothetical protein
VSSTTLVSLFDDLKPKDLIYHLQSKHLQTWLSPSEIAIHSFQPKNLHLWFPVQDNEVTKVNKLPNTNLKLGFVVFISVIAWFRGKQNIKIARVQRMSAICGF